MNRRLILGLWLALTPLAALATAPEPFKDGDVVCFIGDSITHSGPYHGYIGAYYLTRFPERKIKFVNCGISGDSAGGAVSRLEWDILPHRPTVATIMLGMNDVGRGYYTLDKPSEDTLKRREAALTNYRNNLTRLVKLLQEKAHPRLVMISPSPYDQTSKCETPNNFGVNDALANCGEFGRQLAAQVNAATVDFNGPLTALNLKIQEKDPKGGLTRGDRVHPGQLGHLLMAWVFLKAQGVPAVVSAVELDNDRVLRQDNARVTGVVASHNKLEFDLEEKALPLPIDDAAKGALELAPILADLDQETLAVKGLAPGNYTLRIDGQPVVELSADKWAAGQNLATLPTPMLKQAQEVVKLNEQRRNLEIRLRSLYQIRMMLDGAKVNRDDAAVVDKYFADFLAKCTPNMQGYFKYQFTNYQKTKPEVDKINHDMDDLERTIAGKNQPAKHHFELRG